jgi:multiple sugar transport system ATP-binding protein
MAEVLLERITKIYDTQAVLNDISLTVKDQEFLVLVGPSGCGKSTLLRSIAGLETITSGTIRIGERVVNNVAPKDRDIAMVFQNYALYPHMSVYDNMAFGLKMRKVPKADIDKQVREVARALELENLLDRKPKQLSGGQRQRVALGRAIVRNPKVFLMDEPLSNLDAKLRVQMRAEIARLHQRLGVTTVYVTHDQVEAMTMGQRIAVLNKGVIQQLADPLTVYTRPSNLFVAGFIGQMNFLKGTITDGSTLMVGESLPIPLTPELKKAIVEGQHHQVILGIRPEHVSVAPCDPADASPSHLVPIDGTVERTELLGSETLVHFQVLGQTLLAKADASLHIQSNATTGFLLDLNKASLFDAQTTQRIG